MVPQGETVIDSVPERVATISWVNPDIVLSLGVVPVGMDLDTYGNTEDGSTVWKNDKLGKIAPVIGPGVASYQTPWQQSTQMIRDTLGRSDEAEQLINEVEESTPEDEFYFNWSPERANKIESNLFFTWLPEGTDEQDVKDDALFGQIPAEQTGGLVAMTDESDVLAIPALSPLSPPYALEEMTPLFVDAVQRVTRG